MILPPIMENQMEKNMENEMEPPGPLKGVYRVVQGYYFQIMENHMEKNMDNDMESANM